MGTYFNFRAGTSNMLVTYRINPGNSADHEQRLAGYSVRRRLALCHLYGRNQQFHRLVRRAPAVHSD